jgi:Putative Ig domain
MRKGFLAVLMFVAAVAVGGDMEAQCTLTTVTESLPAFFVDEPSNFQIEVCCGTAPYRFEVIGGELPEGIHLNQNGKITGKPRVEGTFTALILISDDAGCSLGQTYEFQVMGPNTP